MRGLGERGRNKAFSKVHDSELRNCVRVEVAVLGSPSLTVLMVSVDVKEDVEEVCMQHLRHVFARERAGMLGSFKNQIKRNTARKQENAALALSEGRLLNYLYVYMKH